MQNSCQKDITGARRETEKLVFAIPQGQRVSVGTSPHRHEAKRMPPGEKRAASRVTKGLYGERRSTGQVTPTGRDRNAPRWTTSAAIVASQAIEDTRGRKSRAAFARGILRKNSGTRAVFLESIVKKKRDDASSSDAAIIAAIVWHWAAVVQCKPSYCSTAARSFLQSIQKHDGDSSAFSPTPPMPALAKARPVRKPGEWIDKPNYTPILAKPRPPLPPRTRAIVDQIVAAHDGPIHPAAVICPERVAAQMKKRARSSRGESLLSESTRGQLAHASHLSTALASPNDHHVLVSQGRFVRATEFLRLFQVHFDSGHSCLAWAVKHQVILTERQLDIAFGNGAMCPELQRAFDFARALLPWDLPTHPSYRSAGSGLDMFTDVMDHTFGRDWSHTGASERDPLLSNFLAFAYESRGLTPDMILADMTSEEACEGAAYADIYFSGQPCVSWSPRNHNPSRESRAAARDVFDRCMDYVRVHQPRIVVIENVNTPELVSAFTAVIRSVKGYKYGHFVSDARIHGDMDRERRMYYMAKQ